MASELQELIDSVGARVSYLRASVGVPDEGEWYLSSDLVDDLALLERLVSATGSGRGTDDVGVAASLFFQAYAFRVASIAVPGWLLQRSLPDPALDNLAVQIARHRPSSIAFLGDRVFHDAPLSLIWERLVDGHLRPIADALRRVATVGERLLWGNAIGSIARLLRAVEGESAGEERVRVRLDGGRLVAAAPAERAGLGRFVVVTAESRDGWFWERTNCCLWYQASGGGYCDDCSLTPVGVRHAAWRAELGN